MILSYTYTQKEVCSVSNEFTVNNLSQLFVEGFKKVLLMFWKYALFS